MKLPNIAPIRQQVIADAITNPRDETRRQLHAMPLADRVKPSSQVAVAVGSRGIGCIDQVVLAILDEVRACGASPFLVPAMGSHGGGTAEGQREVLESYGLGEAVTGVPIVSDMDVVQVGETTDGMPVYANKVVTDADAIIVTNRVKPHTSFRNEWESGLMKICAVGLGKRIGAATIHEWGVRDAMPAAARVLLEALPVVAGVGIVENGFHQPYQISVLPAESIEAEEPALLRMAWQHLLRVPFDPLDMLVLGEMGKDISGTGMDTNVIGLWRRLGGVPEPDYKVLAALDLTDNSHGNAVGIGHCDLIPQRLLDKVDLHATNTNCLTARNYSGARIPITLSSDQAVIEAGLPSIDSDQARIVLAKNTLELQTMWVSTALLDEVQASSSLEQIGPPRPLQFNETGDLIIDWHPAG